MASDRHSLGRQPFSSSSSNHIPDTPLPESPVRVGLRRLRERRERGRTPEEVEEKEGDFLIEPSIKRPRRNNLAPTSTARYHYIDPESMEPRTTGRGWSMGNEDEMQTRFRDGGELPRDQIVRLLLDQLSHLGYDSTVKALEQESKIRLEEESIKMIKSNLLSAQWDRAELFLKDLPIQYEEDILDIKFLIRQQKYLELLEENRSKEALVVLRSELTPLKRNANQLHRLASCMMFVKDPIQLRLFMQWDGANEESRMKVVETIKARLPAFAMVPSGRLSTLLKQAVQFQEENCLMKQDHHVYFDSNGNANSRSAFTPQSFSWEQVDLLEDHTCKTKSNTWRLARTMREHSSEVLFACFSPDGSLLATGSSDGTLILYTLYPIDNSGNDVEASSSTSPQASESKKQLSSTTTQHLPSSPPQSLSQPPHLQSFLTSSDSGSLNRLASSAKWVFPSSSLNTSSSSSNAPSGSPMTPLSGSPSRQSYFNSPFQSSSNHNTSGTNMTQKSSLEQVAGSMTPIAQCNLLEALKSEYGISDVGDNFRSQVVSICFNQDASLILACYTFGVGIWKFSKNESCLPNSQSLPYEFNLLSFVRPHQKGKELTGLHLLPSGTHFATSSADGNLRICNIESSIRYFEAKYFKQLILMKTNSANASTQFESPASSQAETSDTMITAPSSTTSTDNINISMAIDHHQEEHKEEEQGNNGASSRPSVLTTADTTASSSVLFDEEEFPEDQLIGLSAPHKSSLNSNTASSSSATSTSSSSQHPHFSFHSMFQLSRQGNNNNQHPVLLSSSTRSSSGTANQSQTSSSTISNIPEWTDYLILRLSTGLSPSSIPLLGLMDMESLTPPSRAARGSSTAAASDSTTTSDNTTPSHPTRHHPHRVHGSHRSSRDHTSSNPGNTHAQDPQSSTNASSSTNSSNVNADTSANTNPDSTLRFSAPHPYIEKSWRTFAINDFVVSKDGRFLVLIDQSKFIRWVSIEEFAPTTSSSSSHQHHYHSSSSSSHHGHHHHHHHHHHHRTNHNADNEQRVTFGPSPSSSSSVPQSSSLSSSSSASSNVRNSQSSSSHHQRPSSSTWNLQSSGRHTSHKPLVLPQPIQSNLNLTSCSISPDGNFLLVTTMKTGASFKGLHQSQSILVYNIHSGEKLQCIDGQVQSRFVIRAAIGGPGGQLIASGSEDSIISIWNRNNVSKPQHKLKGHTSVVNAVAWNKTLPSLLVSVSDDHTVRVWIHTR